MSRADRALFVVADQIEAILAHETDHETGEIGEAALAALDQLEMRKEELALECGAYLVGERSEAEKLRNAAQVLLDRAAKHARRADRLEAFIATKLTPGQNLADARVELRWYSGQAVEVRDEAAVPEVFWTEPKPVPPRIDKASIRDAIKRGLDVPGVALVKTSTLRVK